MSYQLDWEIRDLEQVFLEVWRVDGEPPRTHAREIDMAEWQQIRRDWQSVIIPGKTHVYYLAAPHVLDEFNFAEFLAIAKWHYKGDYTRTNINLID